MSNLLRKFYELLIEDRKYLKKYILNKDNDNSYNEMTNLMHNFYAWREIDNEAQLIKKLTGDNAIELLKIEDYYDEELSDLFMEELSIDIGEMDESKYYEFISNKNLNEMLDKEDISERIKDCIRLYLKAKIVCRKWYEILKED